MPGYLTIAEGKLVPVEEAKATVFVYANPDESTRRFLVERYGIDEHTLSSTLDPDELARVEIEDDHLVIIFKRPKNYSSADQLEFKVTSIGFFVFKDRVIVMMPEEGPLFDGRPLSRIQSLSDLVLKVLSRTVIHFTGHLKVINAISHEMEGRIEHSTSNSHLLSLLALEKSLVYYVNAIHSNGGAIERLKHNAANPGTPGLRPEDIEVVDDLLIENRQCYEQAMIYSNILSGLMDCRAAIIGNNLNSMMKNLNALVIAVAVPSFVAGVGGMSEFSGFVKGGAEGYGLRYYLAYAGFTLVMIGIGVATFHLTRWSERFLR